MLEDWYNSKMDLKDEMNCIKIPIKR